MKKIFTIIVVALISINLVAQNESLKPGDQVTITNPEFDDGWTGWNRSGGSWNKYNYHDNYYAECYYKNNTLSQKLTDLPNGLYMVKANALDVISRYKEQRLSNYDPSYDLKSYLYANSAQTSLKCLWDERLQTNIYSLNNDDFLVYSDACYAPYGSSAYSTAFNNKLYENYIVCAVTDNTLTFGIKNIDSDRETYILFDKFVVTYLSNSTDIEAYATDLLNKPMSPNAKTALQAAMSTLTAAKGTDNESSALATFYDKLGKAETSVQTYAKLANVLGILESASTKNIWPQTIEEAKNAAVRYGDAFKNGTLTDNDVVNSLMLIDDLANRINYVYLDINVTTPGAMGDSILAKVENFADVQSLKLRGKLNDDDIYTLKNRLTSLIELDLSELDWNAIPVEQFKDKTILRRVILPNNLISIGDEAFYNCQKLQQMIFPSSLQSIGTYAFYRTYNIGNIVLPEGLTSMGNYAFYNSYLTTISFPSTLKSINYYCFSDCYHLEEVYFNGQTTIGSGAFNECFSLKTLKFPNSLNKISASAFADNRSLYKIEFNEGLYQIEDNAFYDCDALTEVTLPSSLVLANASPFDYCDNLTKVTCLSIQPPYMTDQIPYGLDMTGRELYVPALSLSVYKQTTGWDKFPTIKPINSYPENIVITSDYKLNWPDSLNIDYKPNVTISDRGNSQYGSLVVTGNSTLSASQFTMKYDPNISYNNSYWDSERQEYYRNRFSYTSLVNEAKIRADHVTMELWLRANKWEFLTFPYDIKVSDIRLAFEGTPFVIRKYDGAKRAAGLTSETWVNMTADSTLHAGTGYIWRSASTDGKRDYTGFYLDALQTVNKNNIFANTDLEIALNYYESEFEHNRSWNLIGNPYPCFYDTRAMLTSAPITVWDTYQNNYRAYSPQDDKYILNPGQAFFVQRPVNEESITFLKEGRQTNLTVRDVTYNRASARANSIAERSVFNVVLSNDKQSDRTRFVINGCAKMDYESARDASKFMVLDHPVMLLYTIEGNVRYSINERPLGEGVISLGMQITEEGMYTISLDTKVENEVYIVDHLTGTEVRLDGNSYSFHSEVGTFDARFSIRLGGGDTTGIKAIENTPVSNDVYYDLSGRRISKTQKGVYVKNGKKVVVK